jgi:hypothetical protein
VGWRFRRRWQVAPWLRLSLSRGGASVGLGPRGLHLNLSRRGLGLTASPGGGVWWTTQLGTHHRAGCLPSGTCTDALHETPCDLEHGCNPAMVPAGRALGLIVVLGVALLALGAIFWLASR